MVRPLEVLRFTPDKPDCCPPHSISTHNFHINRYGRCLYCDKGSEILHESQMEDNK